MELCMDEMGYLGNWCFLFESGIMGGKKAYLGYLN